MLKFRQWSKNVPYKFAYMEHFCYLCTVKMTKSSLFYEIFRIEEELKESGMLPAP